MPCCIIGQTYWAASCQVPTLLKEYVLLVKKEAKLNACRYFKMMGEGVDPAFYARVIVEDIAVKVAELRAVPL